MTGTIFLILLIISGLIIFAIYKFVIPSVDGDEPKTIEDYEYENKLQKESAYSYHSGDIDKTITLTAKAIEKNPNDVISKFILGKLYLEKKQYKRALGIFEELKKFNPKHLPTRDKLVECYIGTNNLIKAEEEINFVLSFRQNDLSLLHTLVYIYEKQKDTASAINVLKLIIEKEPDNVRIREKLAHLCEIKGEFTRAIQEYEILYEHSQDDDYKNKLIDLYCRDERHQEAIKILEQMISEDEDNAKVIKKLAFLYWELEQYESALKYFEKIIPMSLEEKELINDYISKIYMYLGEYDKIIELCKRFLEKDPTSESTKLNLSKAFLAKGEFQTAIDVIKDLLNETTLTSKEKHIQNYLSNFFCKWAIYFFENDNYQESFEKLMVALQYNDKNPEIYYNLAKTNLKIRNYEEALSQFKHAISLAPENADYYIDLGRLYKEAGNIKQAITTLEKSIELNPNNSIVYFELGLIYMFQDMYESAVLLFKKAVELDPLSVDTRYYLALAYGKTGEKFKAIKEYKKVLEENPEHVEAQNNLALLVET